MSNPYKRKALTLASSFVVAGTALTSGAALAAEKPSAGLKFVKPNVIKFDPRITNPPAPGFKIPRIIIRVPTRPPVVNPAPIRDLQKLRIKKIR